MPLIFTRRNWYGTAEPLGELWTLAKDGRHACAAVLSNPLGVELRILIQDDLRESLVARYDDEPLMALADKWKAALIDKGWRPANIEAKRPVMTEDRSN